MPGPYYAKARKYRSATSIPLIAGNDILRNTDPEVILTRTQPVIDVVHEFAWTASPVGPETLKKIPKAFLTERKLETNSLIASALYYINAASQAGGNITKDTIYAISTKLTQIGTSNNDIVSTMKKGLDSFQSFISSKTISRSDLALINAAEYLKSYLGIYYTSETGFNYALPYFGDNLVFANNTFASNPQVTSAISQGIETGQKIVNEISTAFMITQPGMYIESPKHYHFPTEGKTITIKFPLVNTIAKSNLLSYQQNYELLWILAYQNKPYRTSFSRIIPPKIYTLTIPGQEFFPYCYIKSMAVNFLGTKRSLPVTLPTGMTCETSIPEAYDVALTFSSLLGDVGNTMVSPGFARKVNTGVR